MKPVRWTASARRDLGAVRDYIALDSNRYARLQVSRIVQATRRLERFPDSGRWVPEFNDGVTREIIVGVYRVLYEHDDHEVRIMRVVHGARDMRGSD